MPRGTNMKRNANGTGTIRKKNLLRGGKEYTYWEARCTVGYDPGTGKQIQKTFTGKTQKEVREKMQAATVEVNEGTYQEPSKLTVGEWLDIWAETYLVNCKPRTIGIYKNDIRLHIKPSLGAIKLDALNTHTIQGFYNSLLQGKNGKTGLSPKTVKNIHGVLHGSLKQATLNGYLRFNPSDACSLPRATKKELKPLDDEQITAFLKAVRNHPYEELFVTTLFLGLREGEALGLTWDCVDLNSGTITVNKQMQLHQEKGMDSYCLVPTKNSRSRIVVAAPSVVERLKHRRAVQAQQKLLAGASWESTELVFTDANGHHLTKQSIYRHYKKIVSSIGRPDARYHDLRHSYAVAAITSGIDIKTIQGNLGHATASFTLDVYGHVTDRMRRDSASRMEQYIQSVSGE